MQSAASDEIKSVKPELLVVRAGAGAPDELHESMAFAYAAEVTHALRSQAEAAWGDAVRHRLARIERKLVSERPLFPSSPSQPPSEPPTSGRRTSS